MSVSEVLSRRSRSPGASGGRTPEEQLRLAACLLVEVVSDATASLIAGLEVADHKDAMWRDEFWLQATRIRSRRHFFAALADEELREAAKQAFTTSRETWMHARCQCSPSEAVRDLMKDHRTANGHQHGDGEVSSRARCPNCHPRCDRLRLGHGWLRSAFTDWMGKPLAYPLAAKAQRILERRGGSTAELFIYLCEQRPFDSALELACSGPSLEAQAYKLVGWARDAKRTPTAMERATQPIGDHMPASRGCSAHGSFELDQSVSLIGKSLRGSLRDEKHPGDRMLVMLVWRFLRRIYLDGSFPEPEAVSLSDIFRVLAHSFRLNDRMERYLRFHGQDTGRWRRRAIRLTVLACLWGPDWGRVQRHLLRFGKTEKRMLEWFAQEEPVTLVEFQSAAETLLRSPLRLEALEHQAHEDKGLQEAAKRLRDIYDECLDRILPSVVAQTALSGETSLLTAAQIMVVEGSAALMDPEPSSGGTT